MNPKTIPNRWKWVALIVIAVFALLIAGSYAVYSQLNSGRIPPLALLALAAVISIAIPMVRANLFPSVRDCETEYAFHEQRLEREILTVIEEALGPDARQRLLAAPDQYRSSADKESQALLDKEETRANPDLCFALLILQARFYEKAGDPQAAIPLLEKALDIQKGHFIARMHLAGNYEWLGDHETACQHYRHLMAHNENLSRAMRKLAAAKLKVCSTAQ
jgi:tetratricopeptide (TPR) repeat protein